MTDSNPWNCQVRHILSLLGGTPVNLVAMPGRRTDRLVVCVTLDDDQTWYLKMFDRVDDYRREAQALRKIPQGFGPPVIALFEDRKAIVTAGIDGVVATNVPARSEELLRQCFAPFHALLTTEIDAPIDLIPIPEGDHYSRPFQRLASIVGRPESTLRHWVTAPQPLLPCHGDLTPHNLVMTADGVRLIDFEFFSVSQPLYDATSLCLSPSLHLPVDLRVAAFTEFVAIISQVDRRPVYLSAVLSAIVTWAVRYADRLYANKARVDTELTWEMTLEVAGEVIKLINRDRHPGEVDQEYGHPRSMK